MSDNPISTGKAGTFLRRKVAGVPVLYLLGAFVAVLAVYAWRTKATNSDATSGDATAGDSGTADTNSVYDTGETVPYSSPYAALATGDTVYASTGQVSPNSPAAPAIASNSEWLAKGVAFLIAQGKSGGDAQNALQLYLSGGQLSMTQGQMRDAVIKEYGLPPYPPDATPVAAPESMGWYIVFPTQAQADKGDPVAGAGYFELYRNKTARHIDPAELSKDWQSNPVVGRLTYSTFAPYNHQYPDPAGPPVL